jgi:regulator of replication initiation timing
MTDIDRIARHCASLVIENENLKIRIEKLEAALREIANMHELSVSDYNGMWWTYQRVARKALDAK